MTRWVLIAAIILCLAVPACNQIGAVPIGKVLSNPRDYEGQDITISGTVTDAISLFVIKAFVVSDDTGQIYVVTERILPKKGNKVRIKGTVVEAFSFGDQTMTVLKELPPNQ